MKIVEGDKYVTKQGCLFVVSKYNTAKDILIEFLDDPGAILRVEASQIRRGNIKTHIIGHFLVSDKWESGHSGPGMNILKSH